MAARIPGGIEEFETQGERAFYQFLEGVAKPDGHYLCRYTLDINGWLIEYLTSKQVSHF
jgi:hypothetical protein